MMRTDGAVGPHAYNKDIHPAVWRPLPCLEAGGGGKKNYQEEHNQSIKRKETGSM